MTSGILQIKWTCALLLFVNLLAGGLSRINAQVSESESELSAEIQELIKSLDTPEALAAYGTEKHRRLTEIWDSINALSIVGKKFEGQELADLRVEIAATRLELGEVAKKLNPPLGNPQLYLAITQSQTVSNRIEFDTFEEAKVVFDWWLSCYDEMAFDKFLKPRGQSMYATIMFIASQVEKYPIQTLAALEEYDSRYSTEAVPWPPQISKMWESQKGHALASLSRVILRDYLEKVPEVLPQFEAYWDNPAATMERKSRSVGEFARSLYTQGFSLEAANLLNRWIAFQGDKISDPEFFDAAWYVFVYGTGNWEAAESAARSMVALQKEPKLSTMDPTFGVLDSYYQNMQLPKEEIVRQATIKTSERKKTHQRVQEERNNVQ